MTPDVQALMNRVTALESQLRALTIASGIPLSVERSFESRGFLNSKSAQIPPGFAIAGMGMIREIGIVGTAPQTISVLDYPHSFLVLEGKGEGVSPIYIPYYVL